MEFNVYSHRWLHIYLLEEIKKLPDWFIHLHIYKNNCTLSESSNNGGRPFCRLLHACSRISIVKMHIATFSFFIFFLAKCSIIITKSTHEYNTPPYSIIYVDWFLASYHQQYWVANGKGSRRYMQPNWPLAMCSEKFWLCGTNLLALFCSKGRVMLSSMIFNFLDDNS